MLTIWCYALTVIPPYELALADGKRSVAMLMFRASALCILFRWKELLYLLHIGIPLNVGTYPGQNLTLEPCYGRGDIFQPKQLSLNELLS